MLEGEGCRGRWRPQPHHDAHRVPRMEAAWSPVPGLLHTTSDHRQESCTIRAAKCQVLSVFCSCILGRLSVTGVPGHPGAAVTWKLVNTFPRAPFLSVQEQQAHRVMVLRGGGGGDSATTRAESSCGAWRGRCAAQVILGSRIFPQSEMGCDPASGVEFLCWKGGQTLGTWLPG